MLSIKRSDMSKSTIVRNKTKAMVVTLKSRKLKWKWAGHILRGDGKWSKIITRCCPRDTIRKKKNRLEGDTMI